MDKLHKAGSTPNSKYLRIEQPVTLPNEVMSFMRDHLNEIARHVADGLVKELKMPISFRRVSYLKSVIMACRQALGTLLHLIEDGRGLYPQELEQLGTMGKQQAKMGIPLEILLQGYRIAAKVVWREVINITTEGYDIPPATLIILTSKVLEYLDEISGAVGSSYLATREQLLRQQDRERDIVLQRILARDIPEDFSGHAAQYGIKLTPPYQVIAVAVPPLIDQPAFEKVWKNVEAILISKDPSLWIVLVPKHADIRLLCLSASESQPKNHIPMQFGIGTVVKTLDQIASAAEEASQAIVAGRKIAPDRLVYHADHMSPYVAIINSSSSVKPYVAAFLNPLLSKETHRNTVLLKTVIAILQTSSFSKAAVLLGIHRHSLLYRIGQLERVGILLDTPEHRYRVWLALELMRLTS